MEIRILSPEEQPSVYEEVLEMLTEADGEFLPPLSARCSTTQQDLSGTLESRGSVLPYFEQLKSQRFLCAFEEGKLLGFVSYRKDHTCREIRQEHLPNIYISTLVVRPAARGRGITSALYSRLFPEYGEGSVFTRTWSTNFAHIRILEKFGFEVFRVLENDRGQGVHTVYFRKPLAF